MKSTKINEITKEQLEELVEKSYTIAEILEKLNYSKTGYNYSRIKVLLSEHNLKLEPIDKWSCGNNRIPLDEILIENSTYTNNYRLKKRLVKEKVLEYKCQKCNNPGTWQNEDLSLQLDHINGINNDNRKENLRFLCPNCHSQTDTYGGKKRN